MTLNHKFWFKLVSIVVVLGVLTWIAPNEPIDPWNLLNPKKIATMILALAVIQAMGSALSRYLGIRNGAILTGFLGGIISSTATTASLARKSRETNTPHGAAEILTFLAATLAMLFEGLILVIAGTDFHLTNFLVFLAPILVSFVLIFYYYKKLEGKTETPQNTDFKVLPILKLAIFIIAIISVSKIFQNFFGNYGLLILTSIISLFEIHGSIIANVQLHESGAISPYFLTSLLAVSIAASYISKLILISALGSKHLRNQAFICIFILFAALAASWTIAIKI